MSNRGQPYFDEGNEQRLHRKKCMEASILHLVDLKRAGHSPRFTELHIPPDAEAYGVRHIVPELRQSSCSCAQGW